MLTQAASHRNDPTARCGSFAEAALDAYSMPVEDAPAHSLALTCADVQAIAQQVLVPGAGHLIARGDPEPSEYEMAWARWVKQLS